MPLLEFACRGCGHRYEDLLRHGESSQCPRCEGRDLERLLSTFAVRGAAGAVRGTAPSDGPPPGCGTCGDPRGPGSCATD